MDFVTFFIVLVWGLTLCAVSVWLSYVDFLKLLLKILPLKEPKDYKKYRKLRDSVQYKRHVKKWRRNYMFFLSVYILSYVIIVLITNNILVGFLLSLFIYAIFVGIVGNIEIKQRKRIEKEVYIHK